MAPKSDLWEQKYRAIEKKYAQLEQVHAALEKTLYQQQALLEESEKNFKLLADFSHSWEYWVGPDNTMHYVSPSCKNHTGYSQAEFHEAPNLLLDIVHPEDREKLVKHFKNDAEAPRVEAFEFRIIDRIGQHRWISHTCQPVYDENNRLLGRRASNWEITAQKNAEIERDKLTDNFRKTSGLLNMVLDAIPDIIGVQDPDHNIIRYNKAGYLFLDMAPSDVHGKKCYELIGNSAPCHICATTEVYKTKRPAQVEKYVEELGKWLDVRAYPVLDDNNKIIQVIEHLRDISKEKNAEKQLTEAHERLITILDSIDAHIYVADMETYEILFMNRKMIDDFGTDFVGLTCYASFRNESKPCSHCTNAKLLDADQTPAGGYTWQCQNPITKRWYINFDRAIKWVDDRIVRIQIATDITAAKEHEIERIKIEQQLQQAQKFEAIGTLAGGVAHDFNNLLMGIQGRVSLVATTLESSPPAAEHLKAIEEYIQSATDLTNQLLGFARGGKYEVHPIDINALVHNSSKMFGRTKKEISIHTKFQEPAPIVEADQKQIEQVMLNLYINAWQAMPDGGEIYIETKIVALDEKFCLPYSTAPGDYAKISITDTGMGMSRSVLQRVFDPFFTTKEKGRGTGLGLASAYGIIKNHMGIITVSSELGQGTTFDLYLPLSDQAVVETKQPSEKLIEGSETVLLVDDEKMILDVGQAMLDKLGYEVFVAQDGQKAVEIISAKNTEIDLVILDLVMPGMDGDTTFDHIRAIDPNIPVLLSSGYSVDGKASEILQKGCNGFIQKPFNISKLSQKIRQVLEDAGPST